MRNAAGAAWMTALLSVTLVIGALILAPDALAHRAKEALTTVAWNERTATLEIIHRLHAHDARQALVEIVEMPVPDLTTLEARARLALYVEERFTLARPGGEALPLDLLGAELEGDHVFIYQEIALETRPTTLEVRCEILHDVFPEQVDTVNLELGGEVRTLVFTAGDAPKSF